MGYIVNGEYFKGQPDMSKLVRRQQSTYKQHEHNRQRHDFAKEIIQPFKNGKLNEDFIQAYPKESKQYRKDLNGQD